MNGDEDGEHGVWRGLTVYPRSPFQIRGKVGILFCFFFRIFNM